MEAISQVARAKSYYSKGLEKARTMTVLNISVSTLNQPSLGSNPSFLRRLRVGVVSLAPPRVTTDVVGVEIKSALVSVASPCTKGTRGRSLGQVAKCFCGLLLLLCSQRKWLSNSSRSFGFVGGEDPVGGQSSFLPVKIGSLICFRGGSFSLH
ncbi:unnamed protein product [Microthlaspi erraticum]|uniref:Uncharacterized protein n=1 Tax=Microthlaspi erraticum TaxID=1685480 RepID=A0A6D2J434_9BRAS|nr:unnamed protein product [Microthlaspi erraticum]